MSGLLGAIAAGRMMGSAGQSHDSGEASRARADAQNERLEKLTAMDGQTVMTKIATTIVEERNKFETYAGRLNINLAARKHSEHELIAALKVVNFNHPLASEEGFEARVAELLAEQYSQIDDMVESGEWDAKNSELPHKKKTAAEYTLGREEGRKVL